MMIPAKMEERISYEKIEQEACKGDGSSDSDGRCHSIRMRHLQPGRVQTPKAFFFESRRHILPLTTPS